MLISVWEKNCKNKKGGGDNVDHDPMYLWLKAVWWPLDIFLCVCVLSGHCLTEA